MFKVIGVIERYLLQHKVVSHNNYSATQLLTHLPVISCTFTTYPLHRQQQEDERSFEKYKEKCLTVPTHFQAKGSDAEIKTMDRITAASEKNKDNYNLPHPCWTMDEASAVEITHLKPKVFTDYLAYGCVTGLRKSFDIFSGYTIKSYFKTLDERDMLRRCIFLETIAGVPGFAAAMVRHLNSLRRMKRDHGWIHTLLEEAENERMHLMTFLQLRKPGILFRSAVVTSQVIFTATFSLAYLISPHFCHRFVGYLEEQAVVTYSHILEEIDAGRLPMWSNLPAPDIAVTYWKLAENATMRDVILVIRADENHHRLVNHTLGSMDLKEDNPFKPGE